MKRYGVLDRTDHVLRVFYTYEEAQKFCEINGRFDWTIFSFHKCDKVSTKRQKAAVKFCEFWLNIKFTGNIESSNAVSEFLNEYLTVAKQFATELSCEYSTYGH